MTLALAIATNVPAGAKPAFSAIAVDAANGKVLFANDPDGLRHPASLTKVMTLYLLFQDLRAKRLRLSSPLRASARASAMAPSKLGLKPGETLSVDQAIRALVTRSANDVAATVAENLGGSEAAFANRMTKTARAIGMSRTTFRNASGLPDPGNWTTARDMATLSLRLQRDFPEFYPYFKIMSFNWKGRTITTHNKLLGRYAGVDGIKTGYIRASGFNLTSSARRGNKRIIGVVLGATSTPSRNRYMMVMMDRYFPRCADGRSIAASISGKAVAENAVAVEEDDANTAAALASKYKFSKKLGKKARAQSIQRASTVIAPDPSEPAASDDDDEDTDNTPATASTGDSDAAPAAEAAPAPQLAKLPFKVKPAQEITNSGGQVIVPTTLSTWNIQIGAYPSKSDAQAKLKQARSQGIDVLKGKPAFTMEVLKGDEAIYRARFSGFSEAAAKDACAQLSAKGFGCIAYSPQS